ncbi:hypothetical protein WDV93_07915 [Pantoea ananatis]
MALIRVSLLRRSWRSGQQWRKWPSRKERATRDGGLSGGTPRSTDGHFYLPGTQERCNPPSAKKHHCAAQLER